MRVKVKQIAASGTPDNTTFLRGDGQWGTPSGAGFGQSYTFSSDQTLPSGSFLLVVRKMRVTGTTKITLHDTVRGIN